MTDTTTTAPPAARPAPALPAPSAAGSGPRTDLEHLARTFTLGDATALLALGALGLYGVGVVRTLGSLHAAGVESFRGVPLIPLPEYLLRGLSVVMTVNAVVVIVLWVATAVLVLRLPRVRPREHTGERHHEPAGESKPSTPAARPRWRTVARGSAASALLLAPPVLAVLVLYPIADWLPGLVGGAVSMALILLCGKTQLIQSDPGWTRSEARVALACLLTGLLAMLATSAYVWPPPLEHVTAHLVGGRERAGELVSTSDGVLYLLPAHGGAHPVVEGVPLDRVTVLAISRGTPRPRHTLAEQLGVRLWHLNGVLGLQRDPPAR
jgi:hypothetical protein